ncbi:MAG: hypothetical protein ABIG93_04800 [archaeon]|nr:hypothetical protein [Nanoarchaeota archaeon]
MAETELYDYFRTTEGVFIQRATFSSVGTKLGLPILLRNDCGNRVVDGLRFRKFKTNGEQLPQLTEALYREDLGGDVYQVETSQVLNQWHHSKLQLTDERKTIAEKVFDITGFKVSMIGSFLLGYEKIGSDMDFVVYGSNAHQSVIENWDKILKAVRGTNPPVKAFEKKARLYSLRFGIDPEILRKIIERRNAKFYVNGTEASLIYSYGPSDEIPIHPYQPIEQSVEVTLEDVVIDNAHALMMPRMYQCEGSTVWSFRWMDRGFAYAGDKVTIKGNRIDDRDIILSGDNHYILPSGLRK